MKYLICCWFLLCGGRLLAQELNFNVVIDDNLVQTQDRQIFGEMQTAIQTFLNTTRWTDDSFEESERITGNLLITLRNTSKVAAGTYEAQAQIQTTRPVYGTSYSSPLLNFFDGKFNFRYQPSEPLIFTENVTQNNLTSMLAYYAFAAIGLDYDTFSEFGGNPHYEKMRNIINNLNASTNLTGSEASGWRQDDTRNRAWLAENLNNAALQDLRKGLYRYHRHGLDRLAAKPEEAKNEIFQTLKLIQEANKQLPNAVLVSAFFDAKATELYQTFEKAPAEMRQAAAAILLDANPTNADRYRKLQK
ncbi:MAG: DUF4835 family protein [Bernardetiaceae bacterium]